MVEYKLTSKIVWKSSAETCIGFCDKNLRSKSYINIKENFYWILRYKFYRWMHWNLRYGQSQGIRGCKSQGYVVHGTIHDSGENSVVNPS